MKPVQDYLCPSPIITEEEEALLTIEKKDESNSDLNASVHSEHKIVHPNEEKEEKTFYSKDRPKPENEPASFATSAFANWFVRIDESYLRPWFIVDYTPEKVKIEDEYDEMLND